MKKLILLFVFISITRLCDAQNIPVITHIPSSVADSTGIAVLIHFPDSARYDSCGAPVAIVIAGGPGSLGIIPIYPAVIANFGFIEVFFNFPGGGTGSLLSGGNYDLRGPNCVEALKDVARFCSGEIADVDGLYLQQLIPIVPDYQNVGFVGGSNGGNIAIVEAGKNGAQLPGLKWIANWETPVGDGNMLHDMGGVYSVTPYYSHNCAYNDTTGTFDYSKLKYSDTLYTNYFNGTGLDTVAGFYFDNNNDGIPNDSNDYRLEPLFYGAGANQRAYYSQKIIQLGYSMGLIPNPKPYYIPTYQEAKDFWKWRNGENWIDSVGIKRPDLLFMIAAKIHDHYINAPDHPGVLLQYNKFVNSGINIVRLNPDKAYMEYILDSVYPGLPDNQCFVPFDHLSIRDVLIPDSVDQKLLYTAAACELADRSARQDLRYQLDSVYANCKKYIPPFVYNDSTATDSSSSTDTAGTVQSIAEFSIKNNSPQLFPNPTANNSILVFQNSENGLMKIEITHVTGKIILAENKKVVRGENKISISTASLEDGIYLVVLKTTEGIRTLKLEVLH